jgi:hypothetical protein
MAVLMGVTTSLATATASIASTQAVMMTAIQQTQPTFDAGDTKV